VDAGADQTVELPASVSLQGTATDDQLPAPATLTYSWTVTSGSGVTIADATALATTAQFTNAGAHTLTLTVSDGALSTTDTVQIVVNAAVFPATDWVSATPAEMGLTAAKLDEARDYSLTGGTGGPNLGGSGFIARKGRRVYTWGSQTARYDVKSSSKAIGGIALGLAIDEQRLALANLAKTHLPSLGAVPPATVSADTRVDTITVLQLANHTAGFPKPGGEHALAYDPGTTFLYSDGGLNWLADTLTHVYVQDLNTLLFSRVFTTLGIEAADLQWRNNAFRSDTLDVAGTPVKRREFASGISVNVDAMARIGHLFLRRGLWNDQRLLSESFVDLVRTPGTGISNVTNADPVGYPNVTANYGLLWWTNAAGTLPNVPTDAYWAWGLGDSLIVVIPSLDLVIARTGNSPDNAALPQWRAGWNGDYTVLAPFLNPIVESVAP
jgi:CubicO group peptidase (beta-lactamase class C family)